MFHVLFYVDCDVDTQTCTCDKTAQDDTHTHSRTHTVAHKWVCVKQEFWIRPVDYICVNILVVDVLQYGKMLPLGKLGKGYMGSLCIIFHNWIYNYLKKFKYTHCHSTLFTIAKKWKQPKCSSVDTWIKKMWPIHTMECYSALKWNGIWQHG